MLLELRNSVQKICWALAWILALDGAVAQEDKRVIRSMDELFDMMPSDYGQSLPVDLDTTLTFALPAWDLLFVQTGDFGLYVDVNWDSHALPPDATPGTRIRLSGIAQHKGAIDKAVFQVIGEGSLPVAPVIELPANEVSDYASRWIRMEVDVECATVVRGRFIAIGHVNGVAVRIFTPSTGGELFDFLAKDSRITVTGCLGVYFPPGGKESEGNIVYCPDASHMDGATVKEETLPTPVTASRLIDLAKEMGESRTVSLKGKVTHVLRDVSFVVKSGGSSIKVLSSVTSDIVVGERVLVSGKLTADKGEGAVVNGVVTTVLSMPRLLWEPAEKVKISAISRGDNHMEVIEVEGAASRYHESKGRRELMLEQNGEECRIQFPPPLSQWDSLQLESVAAISVTGLCEFPLAEGGIPSVTPASKNDVTVVSRHQPFSLRQVMAAIGMAAALAIAGIAWIAALKRKVSCRTSELTRMNARLRASYDAIPEALVVHDCNGTIVESNGRFLEFFGIAARPGKPFSRCMEAISASVEDADREQLLQWVAMAEGDPKAKGRTDFAIVSDGGERRFFSGSSAPVIDDAGEVGARLWKFEDFTERQQLSDASVQAGRDEAIGRLAQGIAHDINNHLMAVMTNLAVMRLRRGNASRDDSRSLETAELAAQRAAEVVKQMLLYSNNQRLRLEPGNVNDTVREVDAFLRNTLPTSIAFVTDLEDDLWLTDVDHVQLERVLMNICLNARDAIGPHAGTIRVATHNDSAPDGDWVTIVISDTGHGFTEAIRERIFEPFFTTKERGKGTGLGLAMSTEIVGKHGGSIECRSTANQETCFTIRLPRSVQESVESIPLSEEWIPGLDVIAGARILVVDDEQSIRESVAEVLQRYESKVSEACNGKEALDTLERENGRFDAVVMDLNMPIMSGQDAFVVIRKSWPEIPIIISSGHVVQFPPVNGRPPDAMLLKPFRMGEFLSAVSRAMSR